MNYNGDEVVSYKKENMGFNIYDFWRFTYSNLNADPRDRFSEFIIAKALNINKASNTESWTVYDIEYFYKNKKIRIEVKTTGNYQTWRTDGKICNNRTFSIRKSHNENGELERQNDIYVFCVLLGDTEEEAVPINLENWEFYVVQTSLINKECGNNKTINLNRIKGLNIKKCNYIELKQRIDEIAELI